MMNNISRLFLLSCLTGLVACSGSDSAEQSPESDADNIELVSTATLVNSGADMEVPILNPRITISKDRENAVGLSPDGSELAIVRSNALELGYEAVVSIYSTSNGILLREFTESFEEYGFSNSMGGGFERPELVMWSEDDTLAVLFGGTLVGYSFDARTGVVLAKLTDTESISCEANLVNIHAFDPRDNRYFCVGNAPGNSLITLDTRNLIYTSVTANKANQTLFTLEMSHDGNELALWFGNSNCFFNCSVLSVRFVNSRTLQASRDDDETSTGYSLLGNGYEFLTKLGPVAGSLKVDSEIFLIDQFEPYYIDSNLRKNIAVIDKSYDDAGASFEPRIRLFSLPYGRVVGDVVRRSRFVSPEFMVFSTDGLVAVHIAENTVDVYTTNERTGYTVFKH